MNSEFPDPSEPRDQRDNDAPDSEPAPAADALEGREPAADPGGTAPPEAGQADVASAGTATPAAADAVEDAAAATEPAPPDPAGEPPSDPQSPPGGPLGRRTKIQVGTRREPGAPRPQSVKAATVQAPSTPPKSTAPVRVPTVREPLSRELQQEFDAFLDAAAVDELLESTGSATADPLEPDAHRQGTVIRIHGDNVFFSLGDRHEGVASQRQFRKPPELGAVMDVVVKKLHRDDGLYELAVPGESAHVEDWSDLTEGTLVEARITGANTGGLECKVNTIRGFIPSSQIAMFRVENYAEFLEQRMLCIVTEVNPKRKNLVLSRRAVLEREKEEARQELIASLEVGAVVEGTVRNLRDFGAFVDLGGVDGLVHVSQLSWDRVNHPSDVLKVGQKVRVKIEKIDPQTGKIGLSYRDLLEHPWDRIEEKFPPESVVTGTVSRVAKFGAFVKLAPGIEGLVHISELAHTHVPSVGSVVSEGQEVQVKVLSVDNDAQRIALSMRAILPEPEPEPEPADDSAQPPPPRKQPQDLRGGTDRESGGAQFGLKW